MKLTDINQIKALLARHGFRFSKSMGQNFLVADWVPEEIAAAAGIDRDTGVLEIGPGIGCLTAKLSDRAGKVLSIELDKALKPILAETLEGRENVEILFGDVLRQDLPALVREQLSPLRPVVCANLPYNVTSPVLTALIRADCFEQITVMIQREVARRSRVGGSSSLGVVGLGRAMVHDVDLAQHLFGDVHVQAAHQLQAVHHHVGEFLGDQGGALRVAALEQRVHVLRVQPLEVLQQLAHLHGHGHCHVLGILHPVHAPALAQAQLVHLLLQLAQRGVAVVHRRNRSFVHTYHLC